MKETKRFLCRRCGWITDELGKAPHESLCGVTELPASMRWAEYSGSIAAQEKPPAAKQFSKSAKNSFGDDVEG